MEPNLRDTFTLDQPARRVEKSELTTWLRKIGEETFMDDLESAEHVDALWDEMRFRNSRLIAAMTAENLAEAGYATGEISCILQYLVTQNPPASAPKATDQNVSVVLQPDPNADARSQAQLDAFSQAICNTLSDSREEMKKQSNARKIENRRQG